jgi:hypothetical protein
MIRLIMALCALAAVAPSATAWDLEAHAHVNLLGIDLTHREIGIQLQPAVGLSYTDGDAFVGLAVAFDVTDALNRAFTPMAIAGSNELLTSAGVGYRFRQPRLPRQPWRTSWLLVGGLGSPVSRVRE